MSPLIKRLLQLIVMAMLAMNAAYLDARQPEPAQSQIDRHPLETRALVDPQGVLSEIPDQIEKAKASKNHKELALLYLARSNACRVIADWQCQSESGANATLAAQAARSPELEVRGLIADSRGRMAFQDFSRGENLLGDAARILEAHPSTELSADIFLAYSSLSYALGKNALAAEYAARGLKALSKQPSLPIRIRLLRNQARALAQLEKTAEAEAILKQAVKLTEQIQDPKLSAELYVEIARIARTRGDVATQINSGEKILELAKLLSNSQLIGLGHEVLGLAALNQKDNVTAEVQLRSAQESFQRLKLYRDERRVLRSLITSMAGRNRPQAEMEKFGLRLVELGWSLETDDRKLAGDDFDARLKYAQQKFDVERLEAAALINKEREVTAATQRRFLTAAAIMSIVVVIVLAILFISQRRYGVESQRIISRLKESESRYRILAENSRDLVVRMRPDGSRLYTSPAIRDMLGREPEEMMAPRWDLIHPDDINNVLSTFKTLVENGGSATIVYRVKHKNGEYVPIETLARLVSNPDHGGESEIIYSGRDVSARIRAEQALITSESRTRAVTDHIPALIAEFDTEERYVFANAFIGRIFGTDPKMMIGKTMREVRGEEVYADLEAHVKEVLRGHAQNFEGSGVVNGRQYFYQSNYVPNLDSNGVVQGFYALTFDITALKDAEAKLDRLSRIDSLTGVANRRQFEERLSAMLAHSRRQHEAITLLCLDIDHFKSINDKHGHQTGDFVIKTFAQRLQSCVREDDLVARLGGDEFVVLIESPTRESGEVVAKKLLVAMQEPFATDGKTIHVSTSIGIAYCANTPDAKVLISLADQALYLAKDAGRNTYKILTA